MAPFSMGTAISFSRKMFFSIAGHLTAIFFSNGKIPPSYLHLPTIMLRQSCLRSGLEGLSYQEVRQNIGNHVELDFFEATKCLLRKKDKNQREKQHMRLSWYLFCCWSLFILYHVVNCIKVFVVGLQFFVAIKRVGRPLISERESSDPSNSATVLG